MITKANNFNPGASYALEQIGMLYKVYLFLVPAPVKISPGWPLSN